MKNQFIELTEAGQIESVKTYRVKEKDKEGKEVEKVVTRDIEDFSVGDSVEVHQRILEGDKERIQVFAGVVIAMRGSGTRETFTVRRIVQGEGVERIFPVCSPKVAKVKVKRSGVVRRAKLYYLRGRVGKATRLRERKVKSNGEAGGKGARGTAPAESKAE
jgi:large subunit ribosomal protein L19